MNTSLQRLLSFVRPHSGRMIGNFACMAVAAATTACFLELVRWVDTRVLHNPDAEDQKYWIFALPVVIVGITFLKALAQYGQQYLSESISEKIMVDLRDELFQGVQNRPLSFFHKNKLGTLASRFISDVSLVRSLYAQIIGSVPSALLKVIGIIGYIIYNFSWTLYVPAFMALVVAVKPIHYFGKKIRKAAERGQEAMGETTANLLEVFGAIKVVKAFVAEKREASKFLANLRDIYDARIRVVRSRALSSSLMELIGGLGIATMIGFVGWLVSKNTLEAADLLVFITGVAILYPEIKHFNGLAQGYQEGMAAAGRIFEIMDVPKNQIEVSGLKELKSFSEGLDFSNIHFAYETGPEVLKGMNLTIKRGEIVALVGPSGGGKTTFADHIPRFHDPLSGRILLDGVDLRDFTLPSLRSRMAIVTQEVLLFHDSIAVNIAYGRPEASQEEIEAAARAAQAHEFICAQPEGYDTVVGDRGLRLSGGQRQRLALARAILSDPDILILDEATSSLDAESEEKVQMALKNLLENRTAIIIAHRLSTVQHASRIVVIKDGRIEAQGNHETLMAEGGTYKNLVEKQLLGKN